MKTIAFGVILGFLLIQVSAWSAYSQYGIRTKDDPITITKMVADKIIRETSFAFRMVLAPQDSTFDFLRQVDFGRTFGLGKPAVAYALSELVSPSDTAFTIQVSHNDGLTIWINNSIVYQKEGSRKVRIQPRERDIVLESEFFVHLKKGKNRILVKSETIGKEWIFYLQPRHALIEERVPGNPSLTIAAIPGVSTDIAKLTHWLVLGPFTPEEQPAAATVAAFKIGKLYPGNVSWTIPKVEVFADVINPKPFWGTYYNWNYHTGGVAWAMQNLSEATGEQQYRDYANKWTDFMLEEKPFIGYQVNTLHGFQSTHHQLFNTPLLDFTAAPAMPFVHRLVQDKMFNNRKAYQGFISGIKHYVLKEQIRLPGGNFTRETPEKYTTWTDDMFMGIPFLVQLAQETSDQKEKAELLNDAASQVLAFNQQVFDDQTGLYRHAQYSTRKAKIPYWSRANGWGIWATTEVLLYLPAAHPLRKQLLDGYKMHVNALIKLQDKKNDAWHNVLNRADSYPELSGTAIFTMCIARGINQGWLKSAIYQPYAERGWQYILSCIERDGTVHRICVGTMSSEDVNDYMNRPMTDNDSHGIIGLIFAGIEMQKLIQHR